MKTYIYSILILLIVFSGSVFAQKYEIEPQHGSKNTATESFLIKVWSYAKDRQQAENLCLKNAVYAVMFDTIAPLANNNPIYPFISDPLIKIEKKDFFDLFFEKEKLYLQYASTVGLPETIKIGKKYKVGILVSVNKGTLRQFLETNIGNILIDN